MNKVNGFLSQRKGRGCKKRINAKHIFQEFILMGKDIA